MLTLVLTACLWIDQDDVHDRTQLTLHDRDLDGIPTDEDCDDSDSNTGAGSWLYRDRDGDGHGDPLEGQLTCDALEGYVTAGGDCDDDDPVVYPGATEACDGRDTDCDGDVDSPLPDEAAVELWPDGDGDSFGDSDAESTWGCAGWEGFAVEAGDCDDADDSKHPDVEAEACGTDQDCDGEVASCAPEGDIKLEDHFAVIWGDTGDADFGAALEPADLDGDGFSDLAIGAPLWSSSSANESGAVYVVPGPIEGELTAGGSTSTRRYQGWSDGSGAGDALVAGHFREEGVVQLIIGTGDMGKHAAIYVVEGLPDSGSLDGLSPNIRARNDNGSYDYSAGATLAAGDLDGDGLDDLLVGSPNDDGRLYVVLEDPGGISDLTDGFYGDGFTGSSFATALAIGELNGDGYADVVIGSPHLGTLYGQGQATVIDGNELAEATLDETLSPTPILTLQGQDWEHVGGDVAVLGEHGDLGTGVIAVSAGEYADSQAVWIVDLSHHGGLTPTNDVAAWHGSAGLGPVLSGPGDLDMDGSADLLVGTPTAAKAQYWGATGLSNAPADANFDATSPSSRFGAALASGADLGGGTVPDLAFGAPTYNNKGGVFLYDPAL